mmetsp:Transcript_1766/g.2813  ORF Transcript_1766/g.2813 Transcript_1766/m.2813 type:complete len:96 (-) Transcript_1766:555-842(-)
MLSADGAFCTTNVKPPRDCNLYNLKWNTANKSLEAYENAKVPCFCDHNEGENPTTSCGGGKRKPPKFYSSQSVLKRFFPYSSKHCTCSSLKHYAR